MSKTAFKEMLATTADNTNINSFVESLDNEETWTFTRQLTQLINQLNYLKLQDEQWAYYYQLGMNEGIWTGRVSKRMARDNSMCHSYGRSKHIVEQRRRKFQQQLEHMTGDIDKHMKQQPIPQWNSAMVINMIADLVDKNNYPLRVELERRREMLRYDAQDHRSIQAFYDLGPNQTEVRVIPCSLEIERTKKTRYFQIQAAKFIWKATHDEQALRYEIEMFKHWLQFKSLNSTTSRPIPHIQFLKIKNILTKLILDQKQSTPTNQLSIEERDSTTPESSSCELIRQTMSIAEQRNESNARNATMRTTQLIESSQRTNPSRCTHHITNGITDRQATITQRAQYQLQQLLRLAFACPTMTEQQR